MRLICPNCDAQYEVSDGVIPKDGRDVQCSNCGQTWFQHHPDHTPPLEDVAVDLPADLAEPDDTPGPDEERAEPTPPPPPAPAPDLEPEPEQRGVDPDVAEILRQEAERETQARAGATLETQPDLGLDPPDSETDRRAQQARERMARLRGEEPGATVAAAAAVGSRRELLPDIEEINSTLRSSGDREPRVADPSPASANTPKKRSGFRRGFLMMVVLALLLIALYVFAPQIAQAVPQVDPFLNAYVAQVDVARTWLNTQVSTVLTWLDAVAASQGE